MASKTLCLLLLFSTSCTSLDCYTSEECVGVHYKENYEVEGYGYKSLYGPTTTVNVTSGFETLSECTGALSCNGIGYLATAGDIECAGGNSCSNINDHGKNNSFIISMPYESRNILCDGSNSCSNSNIYAYNSDCTVLDGQGLYCEGDQSCSHSNIINGWVMAYGAHSLLNSIISSEGYIEFDVYLYGHQSGFGAVIQCHENTTWCYIHCAGNGCQQLILECHDNCFVRNTTANYEILPIRSSAQYNASQLDMIVNSSEISLFYENLCSNTINQDYVYDDWNNQIVKQNITVQNNDGIPICCRADGACGSESFGMTISGSNNPLVCSGFSACRLRTINVSASVICNGYGGCDESHIVNIGSNDLYCFGMSSCYLGTINGFTNIYCTGFQSCAGATISSDGNMNIYLLGYQAGYDDDRSLSINITCNVRDECFIFCIAYNSCYNMGLYCHGQCHVDNPFQTTTTTTSATTTTTTTTPGPSSTTSTSNKPDNSQNNGFPIILIVVIGSGVVAVGVIGGLLFWYFRKRKQTQNSTESYLQIQNESK